MTGRAEQRNLRCLWDTLAETVGDQEFLIFQNRAGEVLSFTYAHFNEEINRAANVFLRLGVQKAENVAVQMHSSPEFIITLFALAKIGAVCVPMNEQYLRDEIEYALQKCSVTLALIEPAFLETYEEIAACDHLLPKGIILARSRDERSDVRVFAHLRAQEPTELTEVRDLDPLDACEILFTSGTTSRPKGVVITHENMLYSGEYGVWEVNLTNEDRLLTTMPACHSNFQLAALTPALMAQATLIVIEKYSASRFMKQCREYQATVTQMVAMMARTLCMQPHDPEERKHVLREVLYFLPLSVAEKESFEERFGLKLTNTYGSTESITWVLTDPPSGERKWPSVGRVGKGYAAKIVDEQGQELPHGEVGEILIQGVPGKSLMAGYYRDKEATNKVFANGWLHTGDKGYQDEDGWFYFVDRKVNMLKRAGENISTTEIENVLTSHPDIAEAAVIGVADPIRDMAVKAFVLPRESAEITPAQVREFCSEHMAPFKVPSFIEIVDDFPRTCSLKIQKNLLS